jgi:hypothetical protein
MSSNKMNTTEPISPAPTAAITMASWDEAAPSWGEIDHEHATREAEQAGLTEVRPGP